MKLAKSLKRRLLRGTDCADVTSGSGLLWTRRIWKWSENGLNLRSFPDEEFQGSIYSLMLAIPNDGFRFSAKITGKKKQVQCKYYID